MLPHEVLGVPENAHSEEIKAAYRKLAQLHHPDKGGDAERFKEIKAAYETLTGEAPPDNERAMLIERLQGAFLGVIEHLPEGTNPIEAARKAAEAVQNGLRQQIGETSRAIRKRENVLKRLRSKGSEHTVLQELLKRDITKHSNSLKELEAEILRAQAVIDFLKDYDYEAEFSAFTGDYQTILGLLGNPRAR